MKHLTPLIFVSLALAFAGIPAVAQPRDTIRILAIGNSFSEDAVENNLWNMLDAAGIPAIVANLYIGGCTLERHWNNSTADAAEYRYRKVRGGEEILHLRVFDVACEEFDPVFGRGGVDDLLVFDKRAIRLSGYYQ